MAKVSHSKQRGNFVDFRQLVSLPHLLSFALVINLFVWNPFSSKSMYAVDSPDRSNYPSVTQFKLPQCMPRSRFLGDKGVPLPEFQGDIYKFWGTHHIFQFFTC